MKIFFKIIVWALLSIMMQAGILIYLDSVYFKETTEVEIHEVEQPSSKSKNIDVNIPDGADNISASFDGKYISYNEGDNLKVVDTNSSAIKDIKPSDNAEMLYSCWAPRNNIVLMAEKRYNQKSGNSSVYLTTYNVKNDVRNDFTNSKNEVISIFDYVEGTKIVGISSSYQTGVTYVAVKRPNKRDMIYRVDTNGNVASIGNKASSIDVLKTFQHVDVLLYKDSVAGNLYKYNKGKINQVNTDKYTNGVEIFKLTNDNMMVLGVYNEEKKISSIISGKIDTDMATWDKVDLEKPKDSKDLFVTEDNEILVNESLTGKVKNLSTKDTVSYEGKFVCFTDSIIFSIDNGKMYLKSLSDVDTDEATSTVE